MADTLKARIQEDVKSAMRAGDKERLRVLRMAMAEVKQREVDSRERLDDAGVLSVLDKMIKQRRESEHQYREAARSDLAEREAYDIEVLQAYLPAPLDEAELDRLVEAAVAETEAESMRDMGRVMAHLRPQVQGRADMGAVSARVKARLA